MSLSMEDMPPGFAEELEAEREKQQDAAALARPNVVAALEAFRADLEAAEKVDHDARCPDLLCKNLETAARLRANVAGATKRISGLSDAAAFCQRRMEDAERKNQILTQAVGAANKVASHALDCIGPIGNLDGWLIDLHNLADEYQTRAADVEGEGT